MHTIELKAGDIRQAGDQYMRKPDWPNYSPAEYDPFREESGVWKPVASSMHGLAILSADLIAANYRRAQPLTMLSQLLTPVLPYLPEFLCILFTAAVGVFWHLCLLAKQEVRHKQDLLNREQARTSAILLAKVDAYRKAHEQLIGYAGAQSFAEKFARYSDALDETEETGVERNSGCDECADADAGR